MPHLQRYVRFPCEISCLQKWLHMSPVYCPKNSTIQPQELSGSLHTHIQHLQWKCISPEKAGRRRYTCIWCTWGLWFILGNKKGVQWERKENTPTLYAPSMWKKIWKVCKKHKISSLWDHFHYFWISVFETFIQMFNSYQF